MSKVASISREKAMEMAEKYKECLLELKKKIALKSGSEAFEPNDYHVHLHIEGKCYTASDPVAYFTPVSDRRVELLLQDFELNKELILKLTKFLKFTGNVHLTSEMKSIFH